MNGDRKNAHFPAGTMDSKRYFAPVCDQDFLEQVDLRQHDERVAELNRLGVIDHNRFHGSGTRRLNWVHYLHRFDNDQCLALRDRIARLHEWRVARLRGQIDRADHRRCNGIGIDGRR